jgi:hypothetical protein
VVAETVSLAAPESQNPKCGVTKAPTYPENSSQVTTGMRTELSRVVWNFVRGPRAHCLCNPRSVSEYLLCRIGNRSVGNGCLVHSLARKAAGVVFLLNNLLLPTPSSERRRCRRARGRTGSGFGTCGTPPT